MEGGDYNMRLNPDCIRDILLTAEENEDMCYPGKFDLLDKYNEKEVIYHINQCDSYQLIFKRAYYDNQYCITDLTPRGHDFLANIRSQKAWAKVKETAAENDGLSLNALISISSQKICQTSAPQSSGNTYITVENANNSVIGNNNSITLNSEQILSDMRTQANEYPQDKEELEQIISLIEEIYQEKTPVKKGMLSRFSKTIAKHPWLMELISKLLATFISSLIS